MRHKLQNMAQPPLPLASCRSGRPPTPIQMTTTNPSAMLAEALTELSKAAYQAFSEVETQARQEVARATTTERDKALKTVQAIKQELTSTKAALSQAELTVIHQADTITAQTETIAQLRREIAQWKDQSRNWQEHFLRVEQERCVQASKIDELVEEKLKYGSAASTLLSSKGTTYAASLNSALPTVTSQSSPTQPPPYRTAASSSPADYTTHATSRSSPNDRHAIKRPKKAPKHPRRTNDPVADEASASAHKRPRKPVVQVPPATQQSTPLARPGTSTIIRRVQAVINVKQESDSEEDVIDHELSNEIPDAPITGGSVHRPSRRRTIIEDEESEESEHSESEPPAKSRRLRNRSRINYEEEELEPSDDDDELMLNAADNQEVYGVSRRATAPSRPTTKAPTGSPKKRRKYAGR